MAAERYAERVLANRRRVVLITPVLVVLASVGMGLLEFSTDYRMFFDDDNPQLLALVGREDTHGKNESIAFPIVPDDGDATSIKTLSTAVWLTEAAWQTPWSRRVDSVASFRYTTTDGDTLVVRDLVDPHELTRAVVRSRIPGIALLDQRVAGSCARG